jgi:hypothetical protein
MDGETLVRRALTRKSYYIRGPEARATKRAAWARPKSRGAHLYADKNSDRKLVAELLKSAAS